MLIECKHLNLKGIQLFLTWFNIPIKLIQINLKWLIAMIGYYILAYEINIRVGYKPFKYFCNMHVFANQNPLSKIKSAE